MEQRQSSYQSNHQTVCRAQTSLSAIVVDSPRVAQTSSHPHSTCKQLSCSLFGSADSQPCTLRLPQLLLDGYSADAPYADTTALLILQLVATDQGEFFFFCYCYSCENYLDSNFPVISSFSKTIINALKNHT